MLLDLLLVPLFSSLSFSKAVTLTNAIEYQSLRPCAQRCFGTIGLDTWYLADEIGCDFTPATEECICRPDLQAAAASHLRQCVYTKCNEVSATLDTPEYDESDSGESV